MNNIVWDQELTELALRNQQHATWAGTAVADLLQIVREIGSREDGFPISERKQLKEVTGLRANFEDVMSQLEKFGFIAKDCTGPGEGVYRITETPQSMGVFSGKHVLNLLKRDGLGSADAKHALGNNFILGARESLEFLSALQRPGLTKDALKLRFLDHLVFNNKLNDHKCDNLWRFLEASRIIACEEEGLWCIQYSPAPLTFYCMTEFYLLEASYCPGTRVDAEEIMLCLDRLLPKDGLRDMAHSSLGLTSFPFGGWGRYDTWLTEVGFRELLQLGLVHPLSVIKILNAMIANTTGESADAARIALSLIKEKFLKDTVYDPVWKAPLEGLADWHAALGIVQNK